MLPRQTFPKVDLASDDAIEMQRQNAARFRKKWFRFVASVALLMAVIVIRVNMRGLSHSGDTLFAIAIMACGLANIITMFSYKCPNCRETPSGTAWRIGEGEAAYNVGVHPFPSRCKKCGYYLSNKALQRARRQV